MTSDCVEEEPVCIVFFNQPFAFISWGFAHNLPVDIPNVPEVKYLEIVDFGPGVRWVIDLIAVIEIYFETR
jgi:hypothetical protein